MSGRLVKPNNCTIIQLIHVWHASIIDKLILLHVLYPAHVQPVTATCIKKKTYNSVTGNKATAHLYIIIIIIIHVIQCATVCTLLDKPYPVVQHSSHRCTLHAWWRTLSDNALRQLPQYLCSSTTSVAPVVWTTKNVNQNYKLVGVRKGSLMVSTLDFGLNSPGWSPRFGIFVFVFGQDNSLLPGVHKGN